MFKKKDNSFTSKIAQCKKNAIEGRHATTPCAKEILPMLEEFFKKCMNSPVKWEKDNIFVCNSIITIAQTAEHIAGNTRNYEKLSDIDITSLGKIFKELDSLYTEAIENNFDFCHDMSSFKQKIESVFCIAQYNHWFMHDLKEISKNWRDGMFLQSYENLWKVIHRVNSDWKELYQRGLYSEMISTYIKEFCLHSEEKPEEKKFEEFIAFLNGNKKLVPVYEYGYTLKAYLVVDADCADEIINTSTLKEGKPYHLSPKDEDVSSCEVKEI